MLKTIISFHDSGNRIACAIRAAIYLFIAIGPETLSAGWFRYVFYVIGGIGFIVNIIAFIRGDQKSLLDSPKLTAAEILAEMSPVTALPPRDGSESAPYSKPLRIGKLLEDGSFEMCSEAFVRYRYADSAYVRIQYGMPDQRIAFNATHWAAI